MLLHLKTWRLAVLSFVWKRSLQEHFSYQELIHNYYVQCQLQIYVTKRKYCDFVVWHAAGLHVERLVPDQQVTETCLPKAERFFTICVLPELVGKWYTRRRVLPDPIDTYEDDDDGQWCFCKEAKGGVMVGCDNKRCPIKWFHTSCLEMVQPPAGKWLCP